MTKIPWVQRIVQTAGIVNFMTQSCEYPFRIFKVDVQLNLLI